MKMIIHYDNILLVGLICFAALTFIIQRDGLSGVLVESAELVLGHWQNPHQTPGLISVAMLCITAIAIVRILSTRK